MNRGLFHSINDARRLPTFFLDYELKAFSATMGAWAFVTDEKRLLTRVRHYFGYPDRRELIVKIWQYPIQTDVLSEVKWGRYFNFHGEDRFNVLEAGSLIESLAVQNFVSRFGLAPAVLGIFVLVSAAGSRHIAILTEHPGRQLLRAALPPGVAAPAEPISTHVSIAETTDEDIAAIWTGLEKLASDYGLELPWRDDKIRNHHICGKLVDWQHAKFLEKHLDFLREFYLTNTQFGESKYQTAPALGITEGIRNSEKRIQDLGLDELEFQNASVIDIGCNGGQFLNYAAAKGARYGFGVDWPNVVKAAEYFSNYLGHFNIRYHGAPLHQGLPLDEMSDTFFDYALFLSMVTHVGTPDYLADLARVLVVEVNHAHQVLDTVVKLEKTYWIVPRGKASDHGDRAIFHCFNRRVYPRCPKPASR